jgi:cytochrome c
LLWRNIDLSGIRELSIAATAPAREGFLGGTIEVRLGSPAGELVGQFDVTTATTAPGVIPVKASTTPRDLYVIVRNANAKAEEMTVSIATITFVK